MSERTNRSATETLDHLSNQRHLQHLNRFQKRLNNSNEYWEASQHLLQGGWPELIRQYFYESPDRSDGDAFSPMIIFPGDELGAQRIEPIPLVYTPNLTIGDLVVSTAWARDLSPRLIYLKGKQNSRTETVVKFVKREASIPFDIGSSPELIAIDHMLLSLESDPQQVNTMDENRGRGLLLTELIEMITDSGGKFNFFKGAIHPDQELRNLFVRINLGETRSLVQILNAITHYLDAVWDWGDDSQIHIAPYQGCGAIASFLNRD